MKILNQNKKDLFKYRVLTLMVILFSFSPMLLSKVGLEYSSFSVLYTIFFIYSIFITIFSHFLVYGDFLLKNSKRDLIKHIRVKGFLTRIPYFLLYIVISLSFLFGGILFYSLENELLIGIVINQKLMLFFVSFGLISLYLTHKNRLGKMAVYLFCKYY